MNGYDVDDVDHLSQAAARNGGDAGAFLALAIAHHANERWDDAIAALRRVMELDADLPAAYDCLALTQRKRGELDKALHNYRAGACALGRRIAKSLRNVRTNPILKFRETVGTLYFEFLLDAAVGLADADGAESVAWPIGKMAMEEERTERHGGLYWVSTLTEEGEPLRIYLPNIVGTFFERLRGSEYSNLIGNRGTVLELLGRHDEARKHFDEAEEFRQ